MGFSHQTRGTMAQVLAASSDDATRTFLYKHLGLSGSRLPRPRHVMKQATDEQIQPMLIEMLAVNKSLRAGAPVKHVFDDAVEELERWALYDGWTVDAGSLVRVTPLAEEVTGIRDKLAEDLGASGIDRDGAIRATLAGSSKDFVSQPPDFNGSITKARIALETTARRAAAGIAAVRSVPYPDNSWGRALALLKTQGVIEQTEEKTLAQVYTFVSPSAHVPKGVSEEEWARLARAFSVSITYFLLKKFAAA